jgi:type II secretory pathway pseudopilin PulG
MTALTIALACVAVVAAVAAVLAVVAQRRARRDAEQQAEALRERLEAVESRLRERTAPPVVRAEQEFVITHLGEVGADGAEDRVPVPVRLTAPAFADAVVRETVVQTASLVQGVRRALAPETRNRIRFEMRREIKRSRKDRKAEVKEALREYRARHRAEVADLPRDEGAA